MAIGQNFRPDKLFLPFQCHRPVPEFRPRGFEKYFKLFDHIRVLVRDIVLFAQIRFQSDVATTRMASEIALRSQCEIAWNGELRAYISRQ
jgi:hypothetical protein